MSRVFALLVLVGLLGGGYYYWKANPGASPPRSLEEAGAQLKDVTLTAAVKTALSLQQGLRHYTIEVSTERQVVTLRGELPAPELLAAAERVAGDVPDVSQVVSHLNVNPALAPPKEAAAERSIGERLDDEALEAQARLAFSLNRRLKDSKIGVEAWKKELRLSGTVNSADLRRLAVLVASELSGVKGVTDRLGVSGDDGDAEERRAAAERAIRGNANLKGSAITVRWDGAAVVLEGRVKSGAERDLAGLLAREAAGPGVRNALEIRR